MNIRSDREIVHRRASSERGIALVELSMIIVPLVLIVFSGFEATSYMRQRQISQMLSRETAVKVYRRCSGFEAPRPSQVDAGRARQCLLDAIAEMRSINGPAATAAFDVGLYRCDPLTEGAACNAPAMAASVGDVGVFSSRIGNLGDPFRNLLISQRAAVAVRVSFPYQSPLLGSAVYSGLSALRLGVVTDVTIL